MWRDIKRIGFIFILGLGTGGYLVHTYETERLLSFADRGFCAQRDVAKTRFWYSCQDAAIALELTQRDMQRDAALVEQSDPIANLIRASETVGKKARRK